jgi:hypothetical protein
MSVLPRVGDEVLLSVPQRERVLAYLSHMGAGWLELDLLESPRTSTAQMARVALFIEFVNHEGIARLHGRLDPSESGHLLRFAHKGTTQLLQRRENIHAGVVLPIVVLSLRSGDEIARRAQTLDVSGTGMVVKGLPAPAAGERFRFELELVAGDVPIAGQFEVVRVEGPDRADVRFTAIDQRDRAHIIHRAFQLSRHRARKIA